MSLKCVKCGNDIPSERIAFYVGQRGKEPETCVKCCKENKKKVYMSFFHKTAGDAVVIPQDSESERQAERCYRRAR